jgi:serine/threonine protein kinase
MKTINKRNLLDYSSTTHLKREIKIQKKISHPYVLKLFHSFEDKENVYLILEYAENGSLFHYLFKKKALNEDEAFVFFF